MKKLGIALLTVALGMPVMFAKSAPQSTSSNSSTTATQAKTKKKVRHSKKRMHKKTAPAAQKPATPPATK